MSDNKNNDFPNNQDFIEGSDDLANSMDMNFSDADMPDDEIIEVSMDAAEGEFESLDSDGLNDEWADDFDDNSYDVDESDFNSNTMTGDTSERNWFNIGLFGLVGVGVCALLFMYVPSFFGGTQTVQSTNNVAVVQTQEENTELAQQAISPQLLEIEKAGGLLANPELVGDGIETVERDNSDADGVFEALNAIPEIAESEVEDIFAAINDLQNTNNNQTPEVSDPQSLPAPSDETLLMDVSSITLENNEQNDSPRPPSTDINVEAASAPVAEIEIVEAVNPTPEQANSAVNIEQMDVLNGRMDAIMNRLDLLTKQVETVVNRKTIATPTSTNAADVSGLEQTIAKLEKKVSDLSKQKTTAVKRTQPTKTRKTSTKKVVPKSAPKWELRGASPGQAFVAESGTQNLRTVSVGDMLNGVGRVQSVAIEGGRWVVRGTSGRINQ